MSSKVTVSKELNFFIFEEFNRNISSKHTIFKPKMQKIQSSCHKIRLKHSSDPGCRKIIKQNPTQRSFFIDDMKIYVLTNSPHYSTLLIDLMNIAQSLTRPKHINQFLITAQSLLRGKSLGYSSQKIIQFLKKNNKIGNELPESLQQFIKHYMGNIICPKLSLHEEQNRNYYLFEINYNQYNKISNQRKELINKLLTIIEKDKQSEDNEIMKFIVKDYSHNKLAQLIFKESLPLELQKTILRNNFKQNIQRNADIMRNKAVIHCKDLKITLKAFTKLRDYQSKVLKCVVSVKDGVMTAKSGFIVLPCGAGKTLVGISICTKLKKQTLVICSSDSGAEQWKRQFEKWTQGINSDHIVILTSKTIADFKWKADSTKSYIYISTYSNLKSKFETNDGIMKNQYEWIKLMPWGLIIFDEAQWLPAIGNRQIVNSLLAHVKIGLTATPLRQDDQIKTLGFMIGPQLYVGSWKQFVEHGYLANPKCIEIRTKMTKIFKDLYKTNQNNKEIKQKLYQCNPNKIKALVCLLEYHQKLNDNIIVFCDGVALIQYLAFKLKRPLLMGQVDNQDRSFVFDMFRQGIFKTIFLSRIGDQAIDLPNANVAIELNILKGSRRQMLQRLGRIMRPKQASSSDSYNAIFYTLVSDETLQMKYFTKRHDYLVNEGFQYDLRFFGYDNPKIPDILQSDAEMRDKINSKMRQTITENQLQFWDNIRGK